MTPFESGVLWRGRSWRIAGGDGTDDTPPPATGGPPSDGATPPATPPPAPSAGGPRNQDQYDATLAKLRADLKAAQAGNKELETLRTEKAQREAAALTETQKLEKQATDAVARAEKAETDARRRVVNAEIRMHAAALFQDPSDPLGFLDLSKIEFDDAGEPTNVKQLLDDLLKAKPHLAKAANGQTPIPPTQRPNGAPTKSLDVVDNYLKQTYSPRPSGAS